MIDKCRVEWCKGKPNTSGNGYCRKHYDQMRKYGHILDVRTSYDANRINYFDDHAEIIITDRKDKYLCKAIIDREDAERVSSYRWTSNGKYIRTFIGTSPVYLHRFIMNYDGNLDIDHINGNRLDNRKDNLRIVSRAENIWNQENKCYRKITDRLLQKPYYVRITRKGQIAFQKYVATEEEAQELASAKRRELGCLR